MKIRKFENLKISRGFTMIELLIVIAIVGILAVAVLATINPVEQINRGKDTGSRSDAEQLIGAVDRYYTVNGYYPWTTEATDTKTATGWVEVGTGWVDSDNEQVLPKLYQAAAPEVKESFVNRITATGYNTLFVYNKGDQGNSTYVCFAPKSVSFVTEAATRCGGSLPADFPGSACGNTTDCGSAGDCICLP